MIEVRSDEVGQNEVENAVRGEWVTPQVSKLDLETAQLTAP